MAASVSWPSAWALNTDWSLATSVAVVENSPEVGPSIRRVRSHNVKYTLTCTVDMNYSGISVTLPAFLYSLNGGNDAFLFTSPTDGTEHEAWLEGSKGQYYSVKRRDAYTYVVSFKIAYYKMRAF